MRQRVGSFAGCIERGPIATWRDGVDPPLFNLANMSTPNLPMVNPVGSNENAS